MGICPIFFRRPMYMEEKDFVIVKDDKGNFISGGHIIRSSFLEEWMAPVHAVSSSSSDTQTGGKNVSQLFPPMVIPMGLFVQPPRLHTMSPDHSSAVLPDTLADRLHELATAASPKTATTTKTAATAKHPTTTQSRRRRPSSSKKTLRKSKFSLSKE